LPFLIFVVKVLIPPTSKYLANPGLSNQTFVDGRHILTNDENVNYDLSMKDLKFIIPVTKLILRVGALSTEKDDIPRNNAVCNCSFPLDKSYTFCFLLLIFGLSFSLNC
jgi:hypothetical protein